MAQLTAKGASMVGIASLPPAQAENDPFLPGEMADRTQEGVLAFRPRPSPPRAPNRRSHARQYGHRPSGAGGCPPRKRHGELLAIVVDRRMYGVG